MGLRQAIPIKFSPTGLSDAIDGTNVPPGVCSALTNLIPDPSTRNLWQCRPAAQLITDFTGFSSPGFISAQKVIGTRVYGMIATARNVAHDEPFVYDLVTNTFITVSGITSANTPLSPSTTGAWTPPTMDLIGVNLVVTHPGFTGGGGVMFGWFDITDPAAIVWHGGNTTTTLLPCPPTAVAQFFNRAYFLVNPPTGNPGAYFTDVLTLTITDPTHVLTFGDNVPLTAAAGLPLNTQVTGGIIQSLIVFKGTTAMYQITGDAALTNNPLSVNALNVSTGTLAPNTIAPTPKGLAFVAPDGVRVISFEGVVSDPVGDAGTGVTVSFIYSVVPSRMAAACNAKTYRVSVQDGSDPSSPNEEYWYNIPRACWSGPHTFAASLVSPYNNSFVVSPIGVPGKLFLSDSEQTLTSTYVENGTQLTFTWATSMLPNTQQMAQNAMVETTLNVAFPDGASITVAASDQDGAIFDTVTVTAILPTTVWGGFIWGTGVWQGGSNRLAPRQLKWTIPIVFQRLKITATGNSAQSYQVGDLYMRYQQLGYLLQQDTHTT